MASNDEYQQIQFWKLNIPCIGIVYNGNNVKELTSITIDFGNNSVPELFCEKLKKNNNATRHI